METMLRNKNKTSVFSNCILFLTFKAIFKSKKPNTQNYYENKLLQKTPHKACYILL